MTHRRTSATWGARAALVLVALASAGCADAAVEHRQAEAVDDGVQVTGTLGGSRVAISEGVPDVVFGDCDPGFEIDRDVCWSARTIDGMTVAMVIENPDVLVAGETVEVVRGNDCDLECDQVDDGVVVDVRWDGNQARAINGRMEVASVDERVAARVDLDLDGGGSMVGTFNVRELRADER